MWCDVFIIKLNLEIKQWSVHENPSHMNMNELGDEKCQIVEKLAWKERGKHTFWRNCKDNDVHQSATLNSWERGLNFSEAFDIWISLVNWEA